ncbi:MAG: amidohydrolase, partial [Roseibium sp.]
LQACFDMVSDIPRRLINQSRRIAVGEAATFVALPALTGGQAVAEIARPLWGFKDGKMTFEQAPSKLFEPG